MFASDVFDSRRFIVSQQSRCNRHASKGVFLHVFLLHLLFSNFFQNAKQTLHLSLSLSIALLFRQNLKHRRKDAHCAFYIDEIVQSPNGETVDNRHVFR
jgi:hypothetical protein